MVIYYSLAAGTVWTKAKGHEPWLPLSLINNNIDGITHLISKTM